MAPCGFGVTNALHLKQVMTKIFRGRLGSERKMSSRSIFVPSIRIAFSAILSVAVRLSYNDTLRLNTPAVVSRSPAPTLLNAKRYLVRFQVVRKLLPRNIISAFISALRTTANALPAPPPPPHPTVSRVPNSPSGLASTRAGKISSRK